MGIRFYCPNGHKLNVKAFLAGKRGICPHCGAKVQIPTQSTRASRKKGRLTKNGAAVDQHHVPATEPLADAEWVPPGDVELDSLPGTTEPLSSADQPAAAQEPAVSTDMQDQLALGGDNIASGPGGPPKLPRAKPLPRDPLAEVPNSVWYVRLSDGTQFGPATAHVMRQWMEEGRVGGDCLVWREGWKDWREALDAFPNLRDGSIPDIVAADRIPGKLVPGRGSGDGEHAGSARSRSNKSQTVVITALILAVVAGSVILAWVVLR